MADEGVYGCKSCSYGEVQHIIPAELPTAVQLKTILNHVERHKSFVYQESRWVDPATKTAIEIPIQPRANGRAICSGCGQPAPAAHKQVRPPKQP